MKFRIIETECSIRVEKKRWTSWERVLTYFFQALNEGEKQRCIDAAKKAINEIKEARRNDKGELILEECEV